MTKRQKQDIVDSVFDLVVLPSVLVLGVLAVVKTVKNDRPKS